MEKREKCAPRSAFFLVMLVISLGAMGALASAQPLFGETAPPELSGIMVSPASGTAILRWSTDKPATAQVEYGLAPQLGFFSELNGSFTRFHSVMLQNLSPGTIYFYKARSKAQNGKTSSSELPEIFTTLQDMPPDGAASLAPAFAIASRMNEIILTFNETVYSPDARDARNYRVMSESDANYRISKKPFAAALEPNGNSVRLELPSALKDGHSYAVAASDIRDLSNRKIAPGLNTSFFARISKNYFVVDTGIASRFPDAVRSAFLDCNVLDSLPQDAIELAKPLMLGAVQCSGINESAIGWDRSGILPNAYNPGLVDSLASFLKQINSTAIISINVCNNNIASWTDMIRYANIERGYKLRYWSLEGNCQAETTERIVNYTMALKTVDPSIIVLKAADYGKTNKGQTTAVMMNNLGKAAYQKTVAPASWLYSSEGNGPSLILDDAGNLELSRAYYGLLMYAKWFGDATLNLYTLGKNQTVSAWASRDSQGTTIIRIIMVNSGISIANFTFNMTNFTALSGKYYELASINSDDRLTTINGYPIDARHGKLQQSMAAIKPKVLSGVNGNSISIIVPPYSATALILDSMPDVIERGEPEAVQALVNGPDVTVQVPIMYLKNGSGPAELKKFPGMFGAKNFRLYEAGNEKPITDAGDRIRWLTNFSSPALLTFEVQAPRLNVTSSSDDGSRFARNFTISSEYNFFEAPASVEVNPEYSNWKLYLFDGAGWTDVTSLFGLVVSGNRAGFSSFSTQYLQLSVAGQKKGCRDMDNDSFFAINDSCPVSNDCNDNSQAISPAAAETCKNSVDENCDGETACPDFPKPAQQVIAPKQASAIRIVARKPMDSSPYIIPLTAKEEKTVVNPPRTIKPGKLEVIQGKVAIQLVAPDEVESGKDYDADVMLNSPIEGLYALSIAGMSQQVFLKANREEMLSFTLNAPEAKGQFNLVVSAGGSVVSKTISIVFKPLFLYVETGKGKSGAMVNITVKNYEDLSTELIIMRNWNENIFSETIDGAKEYKRSFEITRTGEYLIMARAFSNEKLVEMDEYLLTVRDMPGSDITSILIVAFSFIAIPVAVVFAELWLKRRFGI